MMRWILLLLFSASAFALDGRPTPQIGPPVLPGKPGVSINLDNVRIDQVANVVFGEILKANYVIDSALMKREDAIRIHVDLPQDPDQATPVLLQVLQAAGIAIDEQAGVYVLKPASQKDEANESFIYRPKYRAVSYLVDLVAGFFRPGAFAYQRGIPAPQSAGQPLQDSGTSAYSVIDRAPDTLVYRGTAGEVTKLQKLLAQLDTPTPEILVKAVVFEVTTDNVDSSALSLAASLLGGKLNLHAGNATAGDFSTVFKSANLQFIADVLSSDRRFKVVSSPQLRVMSGSSARLTVGSETPVLGTATLDKNGNPVQSIDYKPSGVILELKPQIRGDVAELQIDQQISNFIQTTTGVNSSPTLIKRELSTSVGVGSGDVLVLGGMNQEQTTRQASGVSFLPAWLGSRAEVRSRSEVLLILQAQKI